MKPSPTRWTRRQTKMMRRLEMILPRLPRREAPTNLCPLAKTTY